MNNALHNMGGRESKMMKECLYRFVLSAGVVIDRRKAVLQWCRLLLPVFERECGRPALRADLEEWDVSSDLNQLYTNNGIRGILDRKKFETLSMVVPLLGVFVDQATGKESKYPMTSVHTTFSALEW